MPQVTTAFTFKNLLRHYAKQVLTPRYVDVKLGPRRKSHKGQVALHYAYQPTLVRAFSVIMNLCVDLCFKLYYFARIVTRLGSTPPEHVPHEDEAVSARGRHLQGVLPLRHRHQGHQAVLEPR